MNAFVMRVLDLLFPPRCMLCHRMLPDGKERLCSDCADWVLRQTPILRRKNGRLFSISALPYENPLRGSVHRFKFGGKDFYAETYGEWMAACLKREDLARCDLVTWVPVSFLRRRERGYDQAKLLACRVAELLGLPAAPCLKKFRHNPAQSGMTSAAARQKNVRGVYKVREKASVQGKRILLADDIVTTGATLSECARTLKNAGAAEVLCVTLAATK